MSESFSLAALQCSLSGAREDNTKRVMGLVREAASAGAQIITVPELFEGAYFPQSEEAHFFDWARPLEGNANLLRFSALARELQVVIPFSFFERAGQAYYNSVAIIDATGEVLGTYRKAHIPDGPGYEEKFYFRPGDTGFRVWKTKFATIGVGICWDQWFPECARAMTLQGAECLLYPTAIGSEPDESEPDTKDPWQRVMIGHAVANSIPVVASNRCGLEGEQLFYGSSFIADERGDKVAELSRVEEGFIMHTFDHAHLRRRRANWGFFRDRRPELYQALLTTDGVESS